MSACARCEAAIEEGDLRCPICAFVVVVQAATTAKPERAQILRCTECGAATAYSTEAQAPKCAFCAAVMKVEVPVDPIEVAQMRIPFKVTREEATSALRGWLGKRGFFAPKTLKDEAVLESMAPLCWAGWIVNATASVTWAADSDADAHRSAWAPHAGQVSMAFANIVVPASRGLDHEECRLLIPYYDLREVVAVDKPDTVESTPHAERSYVIESFDAQRSAARRFVQEAIEATAKTRVEEHIPGRRFRNVNVACLLEGQKTDRVALPAWVLAYRYRDTPYRAIVHGQRGEVVFGTSPKDWVKIAMLVIGILVVVAAIAALLGYLNR